MRFTPWIVSERVPDYSTLENLVRDPRFAGLSGGALAEALWKLIVDRELGIFHYCPAEEPLWKKDSQDPLLILNVFGFTICHVHAHVLATICRAAGFEARVANISGHEGTEVFYDGRWHYFDADIQMYHRLRPPHQNIVASREDLYKDPSLVDDQPTPSNPYMIPDRPPAAMRKLYEGKPEYVDVLDERIHSMDFRLRPGETLTRYFHHRGRWHVFENYPRMFGQYRSETGPEGPTERFWPRRQWGNGFFHYAPDLTAKSRDAELGADELSGISVGETGLSAANGEAHAVFAFESPYIYCGVPDPWRRVPSRDGAVLKAAFNIASGGSACIECSVYAPGQPEAWQKAWSSDGKTGAVAAERDFTELLDGRFNAKLRFMLRGKGTTLNSFETRLWFMVSPHSLPGPVRAGDNPMRLHSGDRYGLNTREFRTEVLLSDPEKIRRDIIAENQDDDSAAILFHKKRVTGSLHAPNGGKLAWMSAYALVEARKPGEAFESVPATIEIAANQNGPWQTLAARQIIEHPQGWHFALFGEGRLSEPAATAYVRFSANKGMKGFRIAAHYIPAAPSSSMGTLEIEHAWYEDDPRVGRRECVHIERTTALTHEYNVRCSHQPHNERVTLRAPSTWAALGS